LSLLPQGDTLIFSVFIRYGFCLKENEKEKKFGVKLIRQGKARQGKAIVYFNFKCTMLSKTKKSGVAHVPHYSYSPTPL